MTILMNEINVKLCYSCINILIFGLDDYLYCYLNRRKNESSVSCLKKTSLSKYDVMQRRQQCVRNSALWIWDISVPGKICIAFSSWNEHTFISFSGLILLTSSNPDKKKNKKTHHTTNKKTKKNMWIGEDGYFPDTQQGSKDVCQIKGMHGSTVIQYL